MALGSRIIQDACLDATDGLSILTRKMYLFRTFELLLLTPATHPLLAQPFFHRRYLPLHVI